MTRVRVEVCVESPAAAAIAEESGADRVELCSALIVGGLTPSIGTVAGTLAGLGHIGVQVLIRAREGDFVYGPDEVRTMVRDIAAIRGEAVGSAVDVGFVIGALTPSGEVDRAVTAELVAACGGASTTFHRAFDLTADLDRSLDALTELGVDRVLTGGGAQRAADGLPALARLVERGGDTIHVMAGGSIRPGNVARIVSATHVSEIHFRAPIARVNHTAPRGELVRMTSAAAPSEQVREETSADTVRAMLAALRSAG